ncbi:MAG TPA: lysophospholipid acyltransferase family protein, partial [Bacteroidales bacterium]|nr:lysophospholipid acyltransferase family protein [Bacteroidales bacterium]
LFHIYNIPVWLITLLPLRMLYLMSDFFFLIVYYAARYRKRVVMMNLMNSFPEKSEDEIKTIARKFYRHLCDNFIESFYVLNMSEKEFRKRYRYRNPELLRQLLNKDKSIVLVMGHYGNWDWLCSLPLYFDQQVLAIYHPLSNKYFDELFNRIRNKFGVRLIQMKTAYREMLTATWNQILTITLFLTDQRPIWSSIHYWTTFLNQETPVLIGSESIAKKLNQAVVFADIQKIRRGYYDVEFKLVCENPEQTREFEITETQTRMLEEIIVKKPEYWLWSHKRWKHKREEIEQRLKKRND